MEWVEWGVGMGEWSGGWEWVSGMGGVGMGEWSGWSGGVRMGEWSGGRMGEWSG